MTNLYFKIRFKSSASSIGAFIDPLIDRLQTSTRDGKSGRKKKKKKKKAADTADTPVLFFSAGEECFTHFIISTRACREVFWC